MTEVLELNDIKLINARLTEMGKEFRDLTALKQKMSEESDRKNLEQKLNDFNFIAANDEIKALDADLVSKSKNIRYVNDVYGLPCITYINLSGQEEIGFLAKTKDEAKIRTALYHLAEAKDVLVSEITKNKKKLTADELISHYRKIMSKV